MTHDKKNHDDEPERWIEETPEGYIVFKKTPRNKLETSPEGKVDIIEGYHAASIFLVSIWRRDKNRGVFSETDFDEFSQFCSYLTGDPASIDDWRCSYLKVTQRELKNPRSVRPLKIFPKLNQELMTYDIAFKSMLDLVVWHYRDYGFEFPQLIALLDSMIENPQSHEAEWKIWDEAIHRARAGEEMGYE